MNDKNFDFAISIPSKGSGGKTGLWRTKRPVINYDKCTRCRFCIIFCVENTIDEKENHLPEIDYDYCKGCGVCANVCPVNAIEMKDEAEV